MRFSDFLPFFLTAAMVAFIYIKRSKARERNYTPYDVTPVATRDVFFDESPAGLKARLKDHLAEQDILVHSEDEEKILFDSEKIGAFHWGFLYTLEMKEQGDGTLATFGIFGKGPNPPRRKTQEGYLNEFVNSRILM